MLGKKMECVEMRIESQTRRLPGLHTIRIKQLDQLSYCVWSYCISPLNRTQLQPWTPFICPSTANAACMNSNTSSKLVRFILLSGCRFQKH